MKKAITSIILLVIIIAAVYVYFTRTPSAPSTNINNATDTLTATSTEKLYRISQTRSQAKFSIGEVLNGKPFTAVGTTTEVAGDIRVSGNTITMGTIAINARTFKTDSEKRDGAIARAILKSEDPANEFIYFKPAPVTVPSIPANASSTLSFTVTGDLVILGVTKPATFQVSLVNTGEALEGTATTKIKRSDYKLTIPSVTFVASVDDEFTVGATIVAPQVNE